jgi:energy-coupling factor transporter ATP-binding protein EcfA2
MATLVIKDLHFSFPDAASPALHGVTMHIARGSFVVLCGPTGCGKTTLLRHMKPQLLPVGQRTGQVLYQGMEMFDANNTTRISAGDIGMVMQHPDSQIVMEDVRQELVFGLENLGLPTQAIRSRMAEMAHYFGMESWIDQRTDELSGGQKQLLNLASVLVLQPQLLLLDEPTAQLDPIAAQQFMQTIRRLNQELGMTVIMCEHRLDEALPLADRVLIMNEGSVVFDGKPADAASYMWKEEQGSFQSYLPAASRLFFSLNNESGNDRVPLHVKEGRAWYDEWMISRSGAPLTPVHPAPVLPAPGAQVHMKQAQLQHNQPLLHLSDVSYRYAADEPLVLNRLSLELRNHEWLALLGGNAAGKSTLLHLASGLLKPSHGQVRLNGSKLKNIPDSELYRTIGLLPQNPMTYFVCDTVHEELNLAAQKYGKAHPAEEVERMISKLSLERILYQHPHDLSGGEQQKAALACVLLGQPKILLLDEPTKGLDPQVKLQLASMLSSLHQEGLTILMVTHDVEFAASTASRCLLLFDGEIASSGTRQEFFSQNYYYTTSINRMVRHYLPYALTEEDVVRLWK